MTALSTNAVRPSISNLTAIGAFARLELRRTVRNRRYVIFAIGFPVFFYLLYTGLLGRSGGADDPTWRAYFMVSMAAYGMIGAALSGAMAIAQERATGWTRQLRITPLTPAGWVATKAIVSLLVALPALGLVSLAAITINQVSLDPATWVAILGSLSVGVLPFVGLGLLLGFVLDVNSAQGAVAISSIGLAVLGGLWAPVSTFPDGLATIARMLPSYRFADLGWSALSTGRPDLLDLAFVVAWAVLAFALLAWRYQAAEQRARG
jgi:ABC-2 type transport system permease protein